MSPLERFPLGEPVKVGDRFGFVENVRPCGWCLWEVYVRWVDATGFKWVMADDVETLERPRDRLVGQVLSAAAEVVSARPNGPPHGLARSGRRPMNRGLLVIDGGKA